ncbi:MAG: sigma-70 family RNA polymerase sigma factor [Alistipes sp.]|nr:sigma-70 family RNA polymerase sigma factor [Alistipes sp.]MBQ3209155.1 sigma-70 family RNA polymerase sigma factor [Alistipes sp.]MBQ6869122.1 sigma-70 family RNA polymerase sigma factor [Alistipes sp.]MBQ7952524.1 sigma-70 family RNA polymerase sigma factor [Alistipes sp.]MBQ9962694.1 sigma-70 family RNA polymerase sigma factor [Alistipes sp.]
MAKKILHSQLEGKSANESFGLLYNTYIDDLYAFGVSMGANHTFVKDAIHDVFLAMLTKKRDLSQIRDIESYLFRSLNNRIIDSWRTQPNEVNVEALVTVSVEPTQAEHIDEAYIATQMASHLNQVMQKLTYNQRSAVYLRIMCDMKYSKIAAILNCTEHAARKFVSKGLANLRKYQSELGKWIKN